MSAVLCAAGCRQIVSYNETREYIVSPDAGGGVDAGASASACGLPYGSTTCASCAQANCCNEAMACEANPVCKAYESCLGACRLGDVAGRQQCEIDHPAGTANEVSALSACLVTHCESDCGLACGALAGWAVEPDAAAAFQSCMTGSCEQERACAGSAGCDAVTRCYVACPTPDCITTCVASRGVDPGWCFADAGATDASSTSTGFARAASACASVSENFWECVGHVSWPPVQAATTTLQNRVTDSSSGMTISGMKVEACGTEDIECNAPWAVDYTDSSGWVSMQVPLLPASSTAGYLKVTLAPMTSSASVRTYGYWGFPLSQARCVDYSCDLGVNAWGFATPAETQTLVNTLAPEEFETAGWPIRAAALSRSSWETACSTGQRESR